MQAKKRTTCLLAHWGNARKTNKSLYSIVQKAAASQFFAEYE